MITSESKLNDDLNCLLFTSLTSHYQTKLILEQHNLTKTYKDLFESFEEIVNERCNSQEVLLINTVERILSEDCSHNSIIEALKPPFFKGSSKIESYLHAMSIFQTASKLCENMSSDNKHKLRFIISTIDEHITSPNFISQFIKENKNILEELSKIKNKEKYIVKIPEKKPKYFMWGFLGFCICATPMSVYFYLNKKN